MAGGFLRRDGGHVSAYEEVELYAWIGADDNILDARTGEIGLKQAYCPAGMIPMVAVRRDKMEQPYIVKQMESVTEMTGVPRVLARFKFAGVVRRADLPNEKKPA